MRNKKAFFLPVLTSLLSISAHPTLNEKMILLNFDSIGPFERYQEDVTINYTIKSKAYFDNDIYTGIYFGDPNVPNRRYVKSEIKTLKMMHSLTYTVTVPTSICLGDDGMIISFHIYTYDKQEILSRSFQIYPIKEVSINPYDYKENGYYNDCIACSCLDNQLYGYNEEFRFDYYENYFLDDTYYKLDLSQFDFNYSYRLSAPTYKSANMIIEGYKEYFPNLFYKSNKALIPLVLSLKDGKIHMDFRNLYVEPNLLQMSLSPKDGFLSTSNFYMPVNHIFDLEGMKISFEIKDFGVNKTDLSWSLDYSPNSHLIGKCKDSRYCVTSEVEK